MFLFLKDLEKWMHRTRSNGEKEKEVLEKGVVIVWKEKKKQKKKGNIELEVLDNRYQKKKKRKKQGWMII